MKNICVSIGSYGTAITSAFQLKNFDPTTLVFWGAVIGILVLSALGAIGGNLIYKKFNNLFSKKHAVGLENR